MNNLHTHSVLSAPYELPVFPRPAEQPYGMMFGECKAGASIHFDRDVPFHLLFLLKGAACVKVGGKEIDIFQHEFLMVEGALPVDCVCTHRCHYVIICLEKPLPVGRDVCTGWRAAQPQAIPAGLFGLLRYMLATMPLNEKLRYYLIPRVVGAMVHRFRMVSPSGGG